MSCLEVMQQAHIMFRVNVQSNGQLCEEEIRNSTTTGKSYIG